MGTREAPPAEEAVKLGKHFLQRPLPVNLTVGMNLAPEDPYRLLAVISVQSSNPEFPSLSLNEHPFSPQEDDGTKGGGKSGLGQGMSTALHPGKPGICIS